MDSVSAQETFQAACAYMREGSFTQALALFDLILQSYPDHPELLRARAVCLDRLETIAKSERGSDQFSSAFKNPRGITLQTGLSGWRTAVGSPLWGRWALSLLLIGALLVGVASTAFHRRKLEGTKWKMGEYECAFGASSRVQVTYKSQVFPGAYVLDVPPALELDFSGGENV